jgi:hypothetical protein
MEVKDHAFLGCVGSPSWSPSNAGWTNTADEWAWYPLVVRGALDDWGVERPVMLATSCMISGTGHEWPSHCVTFVSPTV